MRSIALAASAMLVSSFAGPARASEESRRPVVGVIVATLGVVGFGTAVVLGRERSKSDDATSHCTVDVCTSTAMLIVQDARSQSDAAFRLMGASALALVSGVALYLSGANKQSRAEIVFAGGGIAFKTTF
jgi:hypothetical protein